MHRSIVAVDIEGSTRRADPAKARVRRVLYDLLENALQATGITADHRDPPLDRGDGAIVLVRPVDDVPKTLLLSTFVPRLGRLLDDHNNQHPSDAFRMRTVVHAGEVHYDDNGPFGEAVDLACRLLDAPELKATLRNTLASLVLVVSDDIHRWIVKQGYDDIDSQGFESLVRLELAGQRREGWIQVVSDELPSLPHPVTTRDTVRLISLPGLGAGG